MFANVVDGNLFAVGKNIENASYGLTLCAECSMIADAFRQSAKPRLLYIVTCDPEGNFLAPCGRCRQILAEHSDEETLIWVGNEPDGTPAWATIEDLLPGAFTLAT